MLNPTVGAITPPQRGFAARRFSVSRLLAPSCALFGAADAFAQLDELANAASAGFGNGKLYGGVLLFVVIGTVAYYCLTRLAKSARLRKKRTPGSELSEKARKHYAEIHSAHPDADSLVGDPEFQRWLAKFPAYQRVMTQGTAGEIIAMLTTYKDYHRQ